ncbi:hypothetical protein BCR42DRAFT_217143 [Absidia repens]|uniref:SPX domain-containing protein n=1 Tax=Absidia repens TaxID=90262 RepID=A0A1X2IMX4_9FUNG|nr:hypothetical protein BCR42DRAFT_217143 [Absidia repens]
MKFGEYLLRQQFTPWETEYLQYDRIKKVIRETNNGKLVDQWLQTEFIKIKNFISRQIRTIQYQLQLIEQQNNQPTSLSGQLGDDLIYLLYDLHDLVRYLDLSLTGFKKLSKSLAKRQQTCSTHDNGCQHSEANHDFIIKTLDQYHAPLNQLLVRIAHIKKNRSLKTLKEGKTKSLPSNPLGPSPLPHDLGSPLPPLPRYDNDDDNGDQVITSHHWVHPDHVFELKTLLLIYGTLARSHLQSTVYLDNPQWSVYNTLLNEHIQSSDYIECTWPGSYHSPNGSIQVNHVVHQDNDITTTKRCTLPWTSLNSCLRDLQRVSPPPPAKDRTGIRLSTANTTNTSTGNGDLASATALIVEPKSKDEANEHILETAITTNTGTGHGALATSSALIVEPRSKSDGAPDEQVLDQTLRERIQHQQWQPMATCTSERTSFTPTLDDASIEIHIDTNIIMKEADRSFGQRQSDTDGTNYRHTGLSMMTVIQHFKKAGDTTRRKMEQRHPHSLGRTTITTTPMDRLKQLPNRPPGPKQQEWPEWLKRLTDSCDWIHALPRFSMYVHLVSRLYGDHVPLLPWWLGYFDRWWLADSALGKNVSCVYGLSRSSGLQPLLHVVTVGVSKDHMTVDLSNDVVYHDDGNDDDDDDDMDDDGSGKEKDIKMLLPKSTTPIHVPATQTTQTTTMPSISMPAMTTSARAAISNMMKKTTKQMGKPSWTKTKTKTTMTMTKMKVEPKVFFANERTFLSWLQFCALLLTVSLNMINFGGQDDSISRICGGMFIVVTILMALYALAKYEFRAWNLLTRSTRYRFDDVYGPAILCLLLVVAMLINFGLRLNSPPAPERQSSSG